MRADVVGVLHPRAGRVPVKPQEIAGLVGRAVHVFAPAHDGVPQSHLHGEIVTVYGVSPTQREVLRTNKGPLQWTRPGLRLTVGNGAL